MGNRVDQGGLGGMVLQQVTRPATYADLAAVPEHLVAEILYGELVTHPRPHPRGTRAAARIMAALGGPFDIGIGGPGGWIFHDEPELHLGHHVVAPDVAGWRAERLPEIDPTTDSDAFISIAPDWVCEVISPSTERRDRTTKFRLYAEFAVGHYWLLNPATRVLEVFALRDAGWTLVSTYSGDDTVAAPPFAVCPMPLTHVLPLPKPPAPRAAEPQDG